AKRMDQRRAAPLHQGPCRSRSKARPRGAWDGAAKPNRPLSVRVRQADTARTTHRPPARLDKGLAPAVHRWPQPPEDDQVRGGNGLPPGGPRLRLAVLDLAWWPIGRVRVRVAKRGWASGSDLRPSPLVRAP